MADAGAPNVLPARSPPLTSRQWSALKRAVRGYVSMPTFRDVFVGLYEGILARVRLAIEDPDAAARLDVERALEEATSISSAASLALEVCARRPPVPIDIDRGWNRDLAPGFVFIIDRDRDLFVRAASLVYGEGFDELAQDCEDAIRAANEQDDFYKHDKHHEKYVLRLSQLAARARRMASHGKCALLVASLTGRD